MSEDLKTLADAGSSPRQLLVAWANDQDSWIRGIVNGALAEGGEGLAESAIEEAYQLFLAEKRLSTDSAFEPVPQIEDVGDSRPDDPTLVLNRLDGVEGVNAIAAGQAIEFDDRLTVLWGQNGSGKTGYSRIVKRAAAVRTHEEIIGNAWAVGAKPTPRATFTITVDGRPETLVWSNELGLGPLRRVSVFDAKAASVHVDQELGYIYTPADLALFTRVTEAIQAVQGKIDAEIERLKRTSRPDLSAFTRGTAVYAAVESLGAATDVSELTALAEGNATDEEDLEQLRAEVAALATNTVEQQLNLVRRVASDVAKLEKITLAVSQFDAHEHGAAIAAEELATAEVARLRDELFQLEELAGPADEHWQSFVAEGERYQQHLGLHDYPAEGDQCLYCRQDLTPRAVDLLRRYRSFFDQTTQKQLTEARRRTDQHQLRPTAQQLGEAVELAEAVPNTPKWQPELITLLRDAHGVASDIAARRPSLIPDLGERAKTLHAEVTASLARLKEADENFAEQVSNRTKSLAEKQRKVAELADKLELRRRLPSLTTAVQEAKRADKLRQLHGDISSRIRRSLTATSKLASEELVNRNFEELFVEECRALNAPPVSLTFQGRSGHAERKKAFFQHKPSEILSEGEQKVLALADFLAECRMSGTTAPILFDDPVSSLDYRRMNEVAKRLCELAEVHQVVVLTHNVMFASALLSTRQTRKQRVKCIEVREGSNEKGIVAPDVEPRLDSPRDLARRVNAAIEQARKSEPAVQDALISRAYDLMRSWCEAFTEQELLASVTQRYRANVMMTKLGHIRIDRLGAATAVIGPAFEKICRYISGHSNPFEQSNVTPTMTDLDADWKALQDAAAVYVAP